MTRFTPHYPTFTIQNVINKVKVKCYPTKYKITITHLGGNYTPRYFAEHFILPWGRKLIDSCKDLDDQIIPYLQKELLRVMELNKKSKSSTQNKKIPALNSPRIQQGIAKCIARKCPSKNVLDVANVVAFGICYKCGEPEHFRCAGIRDIEKKDIIEGNLHYTCSKCLFKNPNALMYDDNIPKDVNTVTTIAEINTGYKCNLCDYAGDSKNKLAKHMGDIHGKHPCGQCGKNFWLRTELDMHMKTIHPSKCCECEKLFENEMDLQIHIKQTHMYAETV